MNNVEFQDRVAGSEILTSDFISSERIHYRAGDELNYLNPPWNCSPFVQASLNHKNTQYTCSQLAMVDNEPQTACSVLPSSITGLLSDSFMEAEQAPPKVPDEVDFKNQFMKYLEESSFHYLSTKVEKYIDEMGGDLALK
ncbi:protein POOR HOMOLOGOUS SYNAPSIS 1 [Quillaja saponaria]|uniref:Protein POOR HOMOLOGOUS SYNAPSIS 1 n=1 Tax=Quillaja saponaria TaxID=32244 RepID=A0AAD7KU79_QUISA|nr:protein POOR HOMOLOGOUS SYNAPSIS 1 [Quillaja saponaria]